MTVTEFADYGHCFSIQLTVNGCQEASNLTRLLVQGKNDGIRIYGSFEKDKNGYLTVIVPKAESRKHHNTIELGAKKIW